MCNCNKNKSSAIRGMKGRGSGNFKSVTTPRTTLPINQRITAMRTAKPPTIPPEANMFLQRREISRKNRLAVQRALNKNHSVEGK